MPKSLSDPGKRCVVFTISLPLVLAEAVDLYAKKNGLKRSTVVAEVLRDKLTQHMDVFEEAERRIAAQSSKGGGSC